jgi:hypothetical protein
VALVGIVWYSFLRCFSSNFSFLKALLNIFSLENRFIKERSSRGKNSFFYYQVKRKKLAPPDSFNFVGESIYKEAVSNIPLFYPVGALTPLPAGASAA